MSFYPYTWWTQLAPSEKYGGGVVDGVYNINCYHQKQLYFSSKHTTDRLTAGFHPPPNPLWSLQPSPDPLAGIRVLSPSGKEKESGRKIKKTVKETGQKNGVMKKRGNGKETEGEGNRILDLWDRSH